MANNFDNKDLTISNNSLTDVYTASSKSMVIAGTIANTGSTSLLISIKRYDARGGAGFFKAKEHPLPVGSSYELPKIVLNTSDKIQVQSSSSSGLIDVGLELLTGVA